MNNQDVTNRPRKLVFGLAYVMTVILIGLMLVSFTIKRKLSAPYRKFVSHDTNYFAQVAGACNSILLQNPLGTNWAKIIPPSDTTIPPIIQNLHPSQIEITSEPTRVFFVVGHGRESGFGIAWKQRGSNVWVLNACSPPNLEKTVYTETKNNRTIKLL
jgi:hypothetical protein